MHRRKNNRLLPVIIVAIIAVFTSFTIISCSSGDKTADKDAAATTTASEQTIDKKTEEKKDESSEKEETTKESTVKATSVKSNEGTKKASKTSKNSTKATTKPTQATSVCYISIEGYCSSKQVNMQSGDTVYDILKRSGANVSARSTGYGIYVEGINGRFEFAEGSTSGWMYYVNGSAPNKSCGEYKVSSGDKITWDYVSEL
ncbi:MAG: DUF4430 domain-containing protein [Bacillota bacterium]|nr:DUF4430 domain-containing protein [Bacillota bacterium]